MHNIGLVIFFLVGLGTVAFAVAPNEIASRMSVIVTLLLTVCAYKTTIEDQLPKKRYSTWMDLYLNFGFSILFLTAVFMFGEVKVCNHVDSSFENECSGQLGSSIGVAETMFCAIMYGVWALLHAIIYVRYKLAWKWKWLSLHPRWSRVVCDDEKSRTDLVEAVKCQTQ